MFLWVLWEVLLGRCLKIFLLQKVPPKVRCFFPAPLKHNSPRCHQVRVISVSSPQNKATLKAPLPLSISFVNNWYFSLYLGNLQTPPGLFQIAPASWFCSPMDKGILWGCGAVGLGHSPSTSAQAGFTLWSVQHPAVIWEGQTPIHSIYPSIHSSHTGRAHVSGKQTHICPKAFLQMFFCSVNSPLGFPVQMVCSQLCWWVSELGSVLLHSRALTLCTHSEPKAERKGSSWH